MQKKALVVAMALAASTMLIGCGGGGGGSDRDRDGDGGNGGGGGGGEVRLTGLVSKGAISFAEVIANEYDESGNLLSEVGRAETDANGEYELKLGSNYKNGIVKLTVKPGPRSEMICDAFDGCGDVAFSSKIPLAGTNFALSSYVKPSGDTVSAAVTPLTHMAAKRFENTPQKTSANLQNAVNAINTMVGFDIQKTLPVDISNTSAVSTADAKAKEYALFNSGLASLIFSGGDLTAAIAKLDEVAKSYDNGEFDANDTIKLNDILSAVSQAGQKAATTPALKDAMAEAISSIDNTVETIKANTDADGTYTPKAPDTTGKTPLERGRGMVANMRTWLNELDAAAENGDFNTAFGSYADSIEANNTFDEDTQAAAQMLGFMLEKVVVHLQDQANVRALLDNGEVDLEVLGDLNDEDEIETPESFGTVKLSADTAGGLSLTLNGELSSVKTLTVDNLRIDTNIDASSIDANGRMTHFTGSSVELIISGTVSAGDASITVDEVKAVLNATEVVEYVDSPDAVVPEDKFSSANFNGKFHIANGANAEYRFDGLASFDLVRLNGTRYETGSVMSLGSVSVDGTFSSPNGVLKAAATLRLTNGLDFDLLGTLDWEDTVEEWIDGEIDAVKTIVDQELQAQTGRNDYQNKRYYLFIHETGFVTGSITVDNNLYLNVPSNIYQLDKDAFASAFDSAAFKAASGLEDGEISFYSDYNETRIELDLNVPEYESSDYFAQGSLTVRTTAQIPDFPETAVIATVNRSKLNGGTAALTLTWADKTYRLNFASDELDPENEATPATGTLTITDGTGVVMEMNSTNLDDNTKITGVVKVDGEQVGTISTESGTPIVRFTDGNEVQFESLF